MFNVPGYSFHAKTPPSSDNLRNSILLDSGSGIDATFCNPDMVTQIYPACKPMVMHTNAGTKRLDVNGQVVERECRRGNLVSFSGLLGNRWLLVGVGMMAALQLAFTYVPTMNRAFSSEPIGATEWFLILGVGALIYGIVGIEKWLRRRGSGASAVTVS